MSFQGNTCAAVALGGHMGPGGPTRPKGGKIMKQVISEVGEDVIVEFHDVAEQPDGSITNWRTAS
jgi:hypothetical protein